ncbi:MAG: hypothetical protein IKR62_08170, partial [Victivallales bacterium]|nr:hypothetical protein [Victivallales bacterium]
DDDDDDDSDGDDGNAVEEDNDVDIEKTDGDDVKKADDDEEPPKPRRGRRGNTKALLKRKGASFDLMNEKRSTIHIDQIVEEKELVIENETAPDEPPKMPQFVISRKTQA